MTRLPASFRVALDPAVRRIDGGRVLVGGSPLRLVRLTDAGARTVDAWGAGEPVGDRDEAQRLARRLLDAGIAHPRPAGERFTRADVTVVIPVRDRAGGLARTRAHLGDVDGIVVVDDGSAEPVPGALRHGAPRGPAAARNTGWRAAASPVVAFVDADVEPEAGWLEALLPHFDDPAVVAVAPRITPSVDGVRPAWLAAYEAARSPLDLGPAEAPVRPRSRVSYVPTATLVVRRDALAALGGFDEAMRTGEDVDFVWRAHAAGWTIRYVPAARVRHPARPTAGAWLRQRFDYGTSAAPLTERHPGAVAPLAVSGWSALAWALGGLGHPVAGAAVAGATTAALVPRLGALEHPAREALRLAGLGHVHAGRLVADASLRAWWPLTLPLAIGSRRARRALAAAAVVPALFEWRERRPALDPVRWTLAKLADDLAYGTGLWAGALRARSAAALLPDLSSWPGRQRAVEEGRVSGAC